MEAVNSGREEEVGLRRPFSCTIGIWELMAKKNDAGSKFEDHWNSEDSVVADRCGSVTG